MSLRRHSLAGLTPPYSVRNPPDTEDDEKVFSNWDGDPKSGSFDGGQLMADRFVAATSTTTTTENGDGTTSSSTTTTPATYYGLVESPELTFTESSFRAGIVRFETDSNGEVKSINNFSVSAGLSTVDYKEQIEVNAPGGNPYPPGYVEVAAQLAFDTGIPPSLTAIWLAHIYPPGSSTPAAEYNFQAIEISPLSPNTTYWLSIKQAANGIVASVWDHFPKSNLSVGSPIETVSANNSPATVVDNTGWTKVKSATLKALSVASRTFSSDEVAQSYGSQMYGLNWYPKT